MVSRHSVRCDAKGQAYTCGVTAWRESGADDKGPFGWASWRSARQFSGENRVPVENQHVTDNLYFEGDPATDSARRHLERVLNEPEGKRRRWPWVVAGIAGVAAWYFWPRRPPGQDAASKPTSGDAEPTPPAR